FGGITGMPPRPRARKARSVTGLLRPGRMSGCAGRARAPGGPFSACEAFYSFDRHSPRSEVGPAPCWVRRLASAALSGIVIEVRPEPAFDVLERTTASGGVVLDLVSANFSDGEVLRVGVVEIQSADAAARRHCTTLRQADAGARLDIEALPELAFLCVVRAGGITWRRADAAVLFANDPGHRQRLLTAETAEIPCLLVDVLGHGLGDAVAERLGHDRVVVVAGGLERHRVLFDTGPGRHGKCADVVHASAAFRSDEIRKAVVRLTGGFGQLLTEEVQGLDHRCPFLVSIHLDRFA